MEDYPSKDRPETIALLQELREQESNENVNIKPKSSLFDTVISQKFHGDQYIEDERWTLDDFVWIEPRLFQQFLNLRQDVLNAALKTAERSLNGQTPADVQSHLTQILGYDPLVKEILSALKLSAHAQHVVETEKLIMPEESIRNGNTYDQSRGTDFFEGISSEERAIFLGGERVHGYTLSGDFIPFGRQWLEVGKEITYKQVAKEMCHLYLQCLEFHSQRRNNSSILFQKEVYAQIQASGWDTFLESRTPIYSQVSETLYREAFKKFFIAYADNLARERLLEEGDRVYSDELRLDQVLGYLLPMDASNASPIEVYTTLKQKYKDIRCTHAQNYLDKLRNVPPVIDMNATLQKLADSRYEQVFGAKLLKKLIRSLETESHSTK